MIKEETGRYINKSTGRYIKIQNKKATPRSRRMLKKKGKGHNPAKGINLIPHFNALTLIGFGLPTLNLGLPSFGPGRFSPLSSQGCHFGTQIGRAHV